MKFGLPYKEKFFIPRLVEIEGYHGLGTSLVQEHGEFAIASGSNIDIYIDTPGTSTATFQAIADGNVTPVLEMDLVIGSNWTAGSDISFATAGTAGNAWAIEIVPGSGGGEGVNIYEDTSNKKLTVMYEVGVSTEATVKIAINTSTNFVMAGAGVGVLTALDRLPHTVIGDGGTGITIGTAATWAEVVGAATKLHYTDAVTTKNAAAAALNSPASGTAVMTAYVDSAGTDLLAAGDAVGPVDVGSLTNGVNGADEVAISVKPSVNVGRGVSAVYKLGTGWYRLEFEKDYMVYKMFSGDLAENAASDRDIVYKAIVPKATAVAASFTTTAVCANMDMTITFKDAGTEGNFWRVRATPTSTSGIVVTEDTTNKEWLIEFDGAADLDDVITAFNSSATMATATIVGTGTDVPVAGDDDLEPTYLTGGIPSSYADIWIVDSSAGAVADPTVHANTNIHYRFLMVEQ